MPALAAKAAPAELSEASRREPPRDGRLVLARSVLVNRPKALLWDVFESPARLAESFGVVETVEPFDTDRLRVTLLIPPGRRIPVDIRRHDAQPGQTVTFSTAPDSPFSVSLQINFKDAPGDRGTEVLALVTVRDAPGPITSFVERLMGAEPRHLLWTELKRFKMLMEAGEIASSRFTRPEDGPR